MLNDEGIDKKNDGEQERGYESDDADGLKGSKSRLALHMSEF